MAKLKSLDPETVEVVPEVKIAPLAHEYNREDLNGLRDKVNEVISYLNK